MRLEVVLLALSLAASACGPTAAGGAVLDADSGSSDPDDADAARVSDAGLASCIDKPAASGDDTWTLTSGGLTRVVEVHVPTGYDPTHATPVVLNFHGYSEDASEEALLSKMNPAADADGFIAIYPEGTGSPPSWNAGACCGTAEATGVDDIQLVRDVLDAAAAKLCVDPKRVYATGMSNGAFMAHRIGCELADRVAAIAPVAGVIGVPACAPSRPVPVMHFHGTADALVPWDGSAALGFISVADSIAGWVARDGCTGSPVETFNHGDASCATYQQCSAGAEVTLCTIDGGGHTWPGGTPVPSLGVTSTDLDATAAMWTFFAAHPLP